MTNPQPLILKMENWPIADVAQWQKLFAAGGVFDDDGPLSRWRKASQKKRAQSIGHFLSHLARNGKLDARPDPWGRISPASIKSFIEEERNRVSERTVYDHVKDLFLIYSAMSPDVDWSWLHKLVKALRASAGLWTLKPRKKTTAQQIYDWGFKRMASVDAEEGDVDLDRAICFRDGLMLAFLITLPLRVRAFTALEIGKHLGWTGTEFSLSLNREIMKDNKDREFALPADFNEPMNLYLHTYRPILLNGAESNHLWISGRGVPLLIDSFYGHLADLSAREFGEHLNPHAFREIAATSIATYAPEVAGIIKDLLGHATMTMSEKHYNRANGVRAFAALEQIVRSVRNEAILRQMKKNKIILELPDEPV